MTAGAQEIGTPEFSTLVDDAQQDPEARSQLREIRSIDGIETDMGRLIDGSASDQQHQVSSLARLVADTAYRTQSAEELRSEAHEITSEPPFTVEQAVGAGWLDQVLNFLARILSGEGMTGLALIVVAAIAVGIATPILLRLARTRRQVGSAPDIAMATPSPPNFAEAASQAEAHGDLDEAIRLLFLDGVDHLEKNDVVSSAATTSTATVRRLSNET
ncbi:MAG: hypothetical protein GY926_05700, partial [bacterium]|nr:hypothetical protein [bacterium]